MSEKNNGVTPDQLQALLQYASKKLGTTPEQLVKTVNQGDMSSLTKDLSPEEQARFKAMTADKGKAEQVLNSPQAQQLIQQALQKKKK